MFARSESVTTLASKEKPHMVKPSVKVKRRCFYLNKR